MEKNRYGSKGDADAKEPPRGNRDLKKETPGDRRRAFLIGEELVPSVMRASEKVCGEKPDTFSGPERPKYRCRSARRHRGRAKFTFTQGETRGPASQFRPCSRGANPRPSSRSKFRTRLRGQLARAIQIFWVFPKWNRVLARSATFPHPSPRDIRAYEKP
jgi:hypothetical protein